MYFVDMEPVILSEDMMMSGFVPLLTTPLSALTSTFVQNTVDKVSLKSQCLCLLFQFPTGISAFNSTGCLLQQILNTVCFSFTECFQF